MKEVIQGDLNSSSFDFRRLVWPRIKPWCGGGKYQEIESGKEVGPLLSMDAIAGIDGLQILPTDMGVRGIASRIQWGAKAWNTFTVRSSRSNGCVTELAKRSYAITTPGCILPYFTCQAYITSKQRGELLTCAVCYTHELIPYAAKSGASRNLYQNDGQMITFLVVDWWKYACAGNYIHFIHTDGAEYCTEQAHEEELLVAV